MGVVTVILERKVYHINILSMAFLSEFTNEIYDQSHAAFEDHGDSTKVFLGVLVTLLPKIIPRIMPAILGDARIREKLQDDEYIHSVEQMFREKFVENLGVFESFILAWKDDTLSAEDLGLASDPQGFFAREDLITGEPGSFQRELLDGIDFLRNRMNRSINNENDPITQVANSIWSAATVVYKIVEAYLN